MSMKKTDLEKNKAMKIVGTMKSSLAPDRFAQGAAAALDKKERRARDSAAGLVPFACKLPVELVRQLHERAVKHEGGLNALVEALVVQGLDSKTEAKAETKAAQKSDAKADTKPAKDKPAK
jgi:hypothetical protein